MGIETTFLFITTFANSILSLFVLFGKKDKTNIIYSIFVLFASMWAVGLAFFFIEPDITRSLYIANFYYVAAAGIPLFFLYFTLVFPERILLKKNIKILIFIPLVVLIMAFLVDKNFLIKEVFLYGNQKDVSINYINYFSYSLYFIIFVLLSYVNLFKSYLKSVNLYEINQLKFIIIGTSIGFIFGMFFNLFLPLLGYYQYIWLGPIFSFSMVASIGYSINKHHLFDIKVVATEILTFILWLVILVRTLFAETLNEQILNGSLLVATIVVGVFIIRSVIKEVRLREQIEKLADDLKAANAGQANLMHFMNHQVKGRFGNAKNIFAELLTNDYGEIPEFAKPLLEKGLDETTKGVDYVQSILKGASAESGTLPYDMKQINFKSLVEEVALKQKEFIEKKDLKFNLEIGEGDYSVWGDSLELGEAIKNIIDNSLNYTPTGNISVLLKNSDKEIVLEVKDTGVGISKEDMEKLFKSGGRGAQSLKINTNSTGYGLAFSKGVIEAHKGKISAYSEGEGKGSAFTIVIPKYKPN